MALEMALVSELADIYVCNSSNAAAGWSSGGCNHACEKPQQMLKPLPHEKCVYLCETVSTLPR